jgi:hypothetical protein
MNHATEIPLEDRREAPESPGGVDRIDHDARQSPRGIDTIEDRRQCGQSTVHDRITRRENRS